MKAQQQGITNKKGQIGGSGDENGLHLLYEGIQKQLSRRPSADSQKQNGAHQPLDEKTGEFILKGITFLCILFLFIINFLSFYLSVHVYQFINHSRRERGESIT